MESQEIADREIAHYVLRRRLGAGGMGEVFLAHDPRLDRPVAVKRLRPDVSGPRLRARFRREARAAARLNHPAIAQIYGVVTQGGEEWIVMEYVEGRTLRSLLGREGALDLTRALRLGREIAEGLAEAHACGIVHRDLKCENVLVTPRGRAKIVDFGMAKRWEGTEDSLTDPFALVGTFQAMSPEQARGEKVSPRSDLFSLGTLLYEVLSGVHPFAAPTMPETLRNVSRKPHAPLASLRPRLPTNLVRLVDRLLEKEPELRPRSAREVARELASVAERLADRSTASLRPSAVLPARLSADLAREISCAAPSSGGSRWRVPGRIGAAATFLSLALSTLGLSKSRAPDLSPSSCTSGPHGCVTV